MKHTHKYLSLLITALGFIAALSSCKKYPENKLWFKNPEKIPFMKGNMTHYIVNGVDSINELDHFFYNDYNNNPYNHPFSELDVVSRQLEKGIYEITIYAPSDYFFPVSIVSGVTYKYIDKGKKIKISGTKKVLEGFKKNIFVSSEIEWEIIYLSKKDDKRKMKGSYNGNTYEIQFN